MSDETIGLGFLETMTNFGVIDTNNLTAVRPIIGTIHKMFLELYQRGS
jgi:hypothetical protein